MAKNLFAPRKKRRWGWLLMLIIIAAVILGALFLNSVINDYPKKQRVMLTVPSLSDKLEKLALLHISDLDGQFFGENQEKLMELIKSDNYHAVFVTGDITDKDGSPDALLSLINQLPTDVPVFFISGDEDPAPNAANGLPEWIAKLQASGAIYVDRPIKWEVKKSVVWILPQNILTADSDAMRFSLMEQGLEASYKMQALEDTEKAKLEMLPEHTYIALSHVPVSSESLAYLNAQDKENIRMQNFPGRLQIILSGHLNNGQARLPGIGAIYAPMTVENPNGEYWPEDKYIEGKINMRGVVQHISPGLGASEVYPKLLRKRWFNPPKISLLMLTKDF
jgi:predicted MPP superfamily phosphohydrolase